MLARIALLVAFVAAGCAADVPEGRYECTDALRDCPEGWTCRANDVGALRCFSTAGGMDAGRVDANGIDAGPEVDAGPCMIDDDCSDGDLCTGVERCGGGACLDGTPVECTDTDPCTSDVCDPATGVCSHPTDPDGTSCGAGAMRCCGSACADTATTTAACGGTCRDCGTNAVCTTGSCGCTAPFADCDGNPGCETNTQSDAAHCGGCSTACDPSLSCIGGMCRMCATAAECDDMLPCTTDACAGTCTHTVNPTSCLIAGVCRSATARNPASSCQECDPSMSQTAWSNRTGTCDDGQYCTVSDTCAGGTCSVLGRDCSDTLACTADSCNEASDRCDHAVMGSSCLISGTCRSMGTPNPANACQECNPTVSQTAWSGGSEGACCRTVDLGGCLGRCVASCRSGACIDEYPLCSAWRACLTASVLCAGTAGSTTCSAEPTYFASDCPLTCCNGECCDGT